MTYIDGLSAVGTANFGNVHNYRMIKPMSNRSMISRNSYPFSCMSYLFDFAIIMDLNACEFALYDRMPINILMWNSIWCMLGAVYDNNLRNIDQSTMLKLFNYTNYMEDALMNMYRTLDTELDTEDSDATRAAIRLKNLNEGSDLERL